MLFPYLNCIYDTYINIDTRKFENFLIQLYFRSFIFSCVTLCPHVPGQRISRYLNVFSIKKSKAKEEVRVSANKKSYHSKYLRFTDYDTITFRPYIHQIL